MDNTMQPANNRLLIHMLTSRALGGVRRLGEWAIVAIRMLFVVTVSNNSNDTMQRLAIQNRPGMCQTSSPVNQLAVLRSVGRYVKVLVSANNSVALAVCVVDSQAVVFARSVMTLRISMVPVEVLDHSKVLAPTSADVIVCLDRNPHPVL